MTYEEYYKNIYKIRHEIGVLDSAHWADEPSCNKEKHREYEAERAKLVEKLEEAFKA